VKKLLPILLFASVALSAFGDSSSIILQKARDVANTRPTGEPPASRQPPGQPAPAASAVQTAPQLPPEQQLTVNELAVATTNSTRRLSADLMALARGTQKPSQATLDKLAFDLAQAVAGHTITAAQRARIAKDIETVFSSSASVPREQVEAFVVDVPLLLKALGVESTYTAAVGNDLRAARKEIGPAPTPVSAN
jgi:hypothetical protein